MRTTVYEETWPDASVPRELRVQIESTDMGTTIRFMSYPGDPVLLPRGQIAGLELTLTTLKASIRFVR